jgi:GT2 family glycosyltransferase
LPPPEEVPSSPPEQERQLSRISVVIVSLNRAESLRRSLEMLGTAHRVVVVDNGSRDGSAAVAGDFPGVTTMRLPRNFGLTKALNIGLRAAEGEYILCLHDDVRLSGEAVTALADYLEAHQDVGMVCPLLTDDSGKAVAQVRELPSPADPDPAMLPASGGDEIAAACVSGAAFMFRAFFLRALRQIEERYGNYGSDVELCAQMRRASKKVVVLKAVTAIHEGATSSVSRSSLESDRIAGTAAYLAKHHGFSSSLAYRLKKGLGGLVSFNFNAVSGAFAGQKIDGAT